jgi:cytochrome P450
MQFLVAGHETTATALTYAIYVIATQPNVHERLLDEIRTTLAQRPISEVSTVEGMHYMNNFVREILRLYSPGELNNIKTAA